MDADHLLEVWLLFHFVSLLCFFLIYRCPLVAITFSKEKETRYKSGFTF